MKQKLCYVIADVDNSRIMETTVKYTDGKKYDVTTIFLASKIPTSYLNLKNAGYNVIYREFHGKKELPAMIWKLYKLFGELKPDIVHTNLFHDKIPGLIAAKLQGVKQRIQWRHHSTESYSTRRGVFYDKFSNLLSTHIVASTSVVARVLLEMEKVSPDKVTIVNYGFDTEVCDEALQSSTNLKEKYNLLESYPIIGVISRHTEEKGIQYTIAAFRKLLAKHPKAHLILANPFGSYRPEIEKLLTEIDSSNYTIVEIEKQIFELYKCFDIFVHVPVNSSYEAFGQVYIESLAMRVPSIFTLSGIANDFVQNEFNALVVPYRDSETIFEAMERFLQHTALREKIVEQGRKSIEDLFHPSKTAQGLDKIYQHNLS